MKLNIARVYDMLNMPKEACEYYKQVLHFDASNIEAIACLASHHFYDDQPEVALRYYRRLVQMGVNNAELWCNLGLCCLYASQYDMTISCFDRALAMADDSNMADIWYNVGQLAIATGDLGLAYQAFKIAISIDNNHAESYNNLGVLELIKKNVDQARINFDAPNGSHVSKVSTTAVCFRTRWAIFNQAILVQAKRLANFQTTVTLRI